MPVNQPYQVHCWAFDAQRPALPTDSRGGGRFLRRSGVYCATARETRNVYCRFIHLIGGLFSLALLCSTPVYAATWQLQTTEEEIKRISDGVLTLMSFTVLPDITTSSLSLDNAQQNDPGLTQITLGGGFTLSREFPLYLEGTLGWSRFDPEFVATDGAETRRLPFKWNSFSGTGGVGWDFPIDERNELKLRPIFNFTLGHVTTDATIIQSLINKKLGTSFSVVSDKKMNAYGLGGSLMLDYEKYREDHEIDVEIRYTNIQLQTFGGTSSGLKGHSATNTAGLWARWRAPTGFSLLQRPLRYVLETSHTQYFGDQRGALGFDHLTSLGAGIEVDSSAYLDLITRTRLVFRYVFGDNVAGTSVGLAVSF